MERKETAGPKIQEILSDPLSQVARKERRNLLFSSIFGIVVSAMGLVPTKISAFGIEFSPPEQTYFIIIIALVIFYFSFAYVLYGTSDFFIWREKYHDYLVAVEIEGGTWSQEDQLRYDELHQHVSHIQWLYSWSRPLAFIRCLFEFMLPILFGIISICFLLLKL